MSAFTTEHPERLSDAEIASLKWLINYAHKEWAESAAFSKNDPAFALLCQREAQRADALVAVVRRNCTTVGIEHAKAQVETRMAEFRAGKIGAQYPSSGPIVRAMKVDGFLPSSASAPQTMPIVESALRSPDSNEGQEK